MKIRAWWSKAQPAYPIKQPTNGSYHAPPAVWRKYVQIEAAMRVDDLRRVHELQTSLVSAGFEAPTMIEEIEHITQRLRDRLKHFEKGLR